MIQIAGYILASILYIAAQVMLFNHLDIAYIAFPFPFLLFLLMLPLQFPTTAIYLIAFGMGLTVDLFTDTYISGLHTFSAVFAVSLRKPVVNALSSSNYRNTEEVVLASQPLTWLFLYILPLVVAHHIAYFFLEIFSFQHFFYTLLKIVCSTIYTTCLCYVLCIIFYKR